MSAPRGLRRRDRKAIVLQVGAETPEEAVQRATGYLARHHIVATYTGWSGGERLKVGIAGLRRYSVRFERGEP